MVINQKKTKLVNKVFDTVSKRYDIMNDIMSFGVHRKWKKNLIDWMSPNKNDYLVDVASGTGDVARLISKKLNDKCLISCVEPNKKMLDNGKKRLRSFNNIKWYNNYAEKLPFKDNTFDVYTISFGLRNTYDLKRTLLEAFRVLKPGGKFFCLEFSKIENEPLNTIYKGYSKLLPSIGKLVVGDANPYKYLIESIEDFCSQTELSIFIKEAGFNNVEYRKIICLIMI